VGSFQATVPRGAEAAIAYSVFVSFWRQGYAQEMARCVIPHLFDTYGCPGLYAEIDTRNVGSIRLVESLEFQRRATTEDADFFKGATSDEHTYAITQEAWFTGPPP
jgi:RimJ/RimL family protein N-acetyltransferase